MYCEIAPDTTTIRPAYNQANLNLGKCGCVEEWTDPRLAVLRDVEAENLFLLRNPQADDESFNFEENGMTHADFSAGVPLAAGAFSITPVLHLQVSVDEATKFHSPSSDGSDFKLWGGVSIGWSNAAEEPEAEEPAAEE